MAQSSYALFMLLLNNAHTHLALQPYPHAMAHENNLFNMHLFISCTPYLKFAYFALQRESEREKWCGMCDCIYVRVCARFCLVFACIKYLREHECKSANVQLQYIHFINQNDNNALDYNVHLHTHTHRVYGCRYVVD